MQLFLILSLQPALPPAVILAWSEKNTTYSA